MFIFTGTRHSQSVLWRPRARSRYVSKLSQLFYLGVSRLNAHDSLHHDLRCVMCDTPGAGWDGMIVFTFHILLQSAVFSPEHVTDVQIWHRLPSHLHCVYSQAPGQVLSPHLNKHSAYIWWSNNWNISTLLTEFTETQLRLFWLILLRTVQHSDY